MRRARARGLVLGALLLTSLSLAGVAQAGTTSDRLSETRRQLRAARARLSQAKQTDAQLRATITAISGQLSTIRARLDDLRASVTRIEVRMAATERHIAVLDARRRSYAASIAGQARQLYILGPAGAESWLGSTSFADFIGRSTNLDFVARADEAALEGVATIRHEETRLRTSLAEERATVAKARDEAAQQAALVAEGLDTQRRAESRLSSRVADYRSEVQDLAAEESRIEAIILARSSVYTGGPISRSGFAWPIRGPINSPYGPRNGGFHTGIDIGCSTGDPIGASKGGTVIASEWGGGYGWMIIIDHGGGVTTLYAHQSSLVAHQGDRVRQHQVVGRCGATGNATGPHLHFEVRVNGQHQNPMDFLP